MKTHLEKEKGNGENPLKLSRRRTGITSVNVWSLLGALLSVPPTRVGGTQGRITSGRILKWGGGTMA